jgi:hypothetical protein
MDREDESRKAPPRVALIHALAHSVAPINAEFERAWPECVRMNLLDDSLAADLARDGTGLDARMTERFLALAAYALGTGADGILFTCSAFGACIDAVKARWPAVPVQKPNEAMIAEAVAAVRSGGATGRIGLVATFAPTLASMVGEFPPGTELVPEHAGGALEALDRGDAATHDRLAVAAAQRVVARGSTVVALAQFSLARAAPAIAAALPATVAVLTTPASAVRALRSAWRLRLGSEP